ncbi:hypothetical protein ACHAXA_002174 [Cyclostephanos tholiformis]|jgi:hypothetical protein|uniref:Uncharacterized protein n=1 Tax=Cyclostephanos tholiformis TaxID=382380 RepID=A0ABD3RVI6_9STRA
MYRDMRMAFIVIDGYGTDSSSSRYFEGETCFGLVYTIGHNIVDRRGHNSSNDSSIVAA